MLKKYSCKICKSKFYTKLGKKEHQKIELKDYFQDPVPAKKKFLFNNLIKAKKDIIQDSIILKNEKKYFLFFPLEKYSKKHDRLYELCTLSKDSVKGNVLGNVIKKSKIHFPSQFIFNNFSSLEFEETSKLIKYLEEISNQ